MIDDLLSQAIDLGFVVNQLHQLDDGSWRCNFRRNYHYTDVASGNTIEEALANAVDLLYTATYVAPHVFTGLAVSDVALFKPRFLNKPSIGRRP